MFLVKEFVFKVVFAPRKATPALVYIVQALEYEEAVKKISMLYQSAKSIDFVGELSGTIPHKE